MGGARARVVVSFLGAVLLGLSAVPVTASPAGAQTDPTQPLTDPIPEEAVPAGFGLTVEEVVQLPRSEPTPTPTDPRLMRHARINYLGELPDGSGRHYVPDLNGTLYFVEDGTPHPYLDVRAAVGPNFWSGRGLGSGFGFVAFHPEFRRNGKFYTVHTEALSALTSETPTWTQPNPSHHGVITEWIADDPRADTFSGTRREVLRVGFRTFIHGFQEIAFNPTARRGDRDYGLLYIGSGDGGAGTTSTDPQNLGLPHGKVLRIDPAGRNSLNGQYGIPRSNPFVGEEGALGEVYALGLRNPHRFSWDPQSPHRMYLGMIGEKRVESIYEVRPGDNFGWTLREGPVATQPGNPNCDVFPLPPDDDELGFTYPVAAYDHERPAGLPGCSDSGFAVIGGFVYRGREIPELRGRYLFGEDVGGELYYTETREMRRGGDLATIHELALFDDAGQPVTMQELAGDERVDLRFGRDAEGRIYILSKANGKIWRVTGTRPFARCETDDTSLRRVMDGEHWDPVTPEKWQFRDRQAILAEPGVARPGPRRPFEYAVLTAGPELGAVQIDAEVRLDTPVEVTNRDVIVVFGWQSDTRFYYAHLSSDNTIYPHNGIFVVDDADRFRIDQQWNGFTGAPPAISDQDWHDIRVTHCAATGEIAVYVDGSDTPLMTAVDRTFGAGRVGFGSFDNVGRMRNLRVRGEEPESLVIPELTDDLVAHYDFEHAVSASPASEADQGRSNTDLGLVNGGTDMRVRGGAHPGSFHSLRTQQVSPDAAGNDDWKAGIYDAAGVDSLSAFNAAREVTVMGWFRVTGTAPAPNTTTPDPNDLYNAVGLAGVLSGDSDGHAVRALLEVINVSGELRVVALGRRVDGSASQTFAASQPWTEILPPNEWVFLAATFDFDEGTMALYRNGQPLDGFYAVAGDPWGVAGDPEPDLASATDPAGIKIGGSFPQNTAERNPCNCTMDSLMFLDRAITADEVAAQYTRFAGTS